MRRESKNWSVLDKLADAIDAAAADKSALEVLETEAKSIRGLEPSQEALLWYFRSNIQASLQNLEDPTSWDWRQRFRERQILYLRRARSHPGYPKLNPLARAQATTNLANTLNNLGRSVEAIELYDEALKAEPRFAMALGNRGLARARFAAEIYDKRHAGAILVSASDDLAAAIASGAIWDGDYPEARHLFSSKAKQIDAAVGGIEKLRKTIDWDGFSLGKTKAERKFRAWCLQRRLFVNPLNVIEARPFAATDRITLPAHNAKIEDPPHFIAWYNQLKQEFAAARFLCFEGEISDHPHFADNDLALVDTQDFPAFGLSYEKTRLAFRCAYGILDKVAGFINAYFQLNEPPEKVSIRSIWRKGKVLPRPEFATMQNLHLRGLYWLAMDVIGDVPSDQDSITPDAAHLKALRNALEHRCLILRVFDSGQPMGVVETTDVETFRLHTLQILKLARAALLYLPLAVHREEALRDENKNQTLVMPMVLNPYNPKNRF